MQSSGKKGKRDNSGIVFIFLNENIHCDPALEPSPWDSSDEGPQSMFIRTVSIR